MKYLTRLACAFLILLPAAFARADDTSAQKNVVREIERLASHDKSEREQATRNLSVLGLVTPEPISRAILDDKRRDPRQWTAKETLRIQLLLAAGGIDHPVVRKALEEVAHNENERVAFRATAVLSLGRLSLPESAAFKLMDLVKNASPALKSGSVTPVIGAVGSRSPANQDPYLARMAILALGQVRFSKSQPLLWEVVQDESRDPFQRGAALMALAEFDNPHYAAPLQDYVENHLDGVIAKDPVSMFLVDGALQALDASLDKNSDTSKIETMLKRQDLPLRYVHQLVLSLAHTDNAAKASVVKPWLDESYPHLIRVGATVSLAHLGEDVEAQADVLGRLANDVRADQFIRAYSAISLGPLSTHKVVPHLRKVLGKSHDNIILINAANAAGVNEVEGTTELLVAALYQKDAYVLAEALGYLMDRPVDEGVVGRYTRLVSDRDPYVRRKAVIALEGYSGRNVTKALSRALRDKSPKIREEALVTIAANQEGSLKEAVAELIEDREATVSRWARETLVCLRMRETTKILKRHLEERRRHTTGGTIHHDWRRRRDLYERRVMQTSPEDIQAWRDLLSGGGVPSGAPGGGGHVVKNNTSTYREAWKQAGPPPTMPDPIGFTYREYWSTCGGTHAPVRYVYQEPQYDVEELKQYKVEVKEHQKRVDEIYKNSEEYQVSRLYSTLGLPEDDPRAHLLERLERGYFRTGRTTEKYPDQDDDDWRSGDREEFYRQQNP